MIESNPERQGSEPSFYRLGPFRLDAIGKRLQLGDNRLSADAQQVDILLCLIRAYPGIVAKDDLIDRVWGGRFVTDAALHKSISELRKILRESGDGQDWIETRHRRGYQLRDGAVPEFAANSPETAPIVADLRDGTTRAAASAFSGGWWLWSSFLALACVAAWWFLTPSTPTADRPATGPVAIAPATRDRLRTLDRAALVTTIRDALGQDELLVQAAIEALRDPQAVAVDPDRVPLADKFAGIAAYRSGDFDAAMAWYRNALAGFERSGNSVEQGNVLNNMGVLLSESGQQPDQAADWFRKSLALREQSGDPAAILASHKNLGNLWLEAGRIPEAEQAIVAYVEAATKIGVAADQADAALFRGDLALAKGTGDAAGWFEQARALAMQNGLAVVAASAEQRLGRVALLDGDARAAKAAFRSAMALYEQSNETHQRAVVLYNLATAEEALGDVAAALEHYSSVLTSAPASDSTLRVDAELGRARALWASADVDGANAALDAAQREATTLGNPVALVPVLLARSQQAVLLQQPTAARAHLEDARDRLAGIDDWESTSALALQDAWVSMAHGDHAAALAGLDHLAATAAQRRDRGLLGRIDRVRSYAHLGSGRPDLALAYSMSALDRRAPPSIPTDTAQARDVLPWITLGTAVAGFLLGVLIMGVRLRRRK